MRTAGRAVAALVLSAIALYLLFPLTGELRNFPFATIALAALAGFLVRRRVGDALLLGAVHWAAGWAEELVGVQFMACLVLPVLALTLRPVFAALVGASAFSLVVAGLFLKERFAGSVLTWQDLRYFFLQFGDNVGVMRGQPTLVVYGLIATVLFAVACVVCWKLDTRVAARSQRWRGAWLVPPLCIATVIWAAGILQTHAHEALARGAWAWSEIAHEQPISTFLSTVGVDASPNAPRVDTSRFRADVRQAVQAGAVERQPADIVLVLQESQFNPAAIAGCPQALCDFPAFGAGAATRAHGPMRVHVFGGGTWLTEFTLNTGVPQSLFGAAGDFAPFNAALRTQRSFVRSLRDAGYRAVAVYPTEGGMMNGRQAYAAYGFDHLYTPSELGFPGGFGTRDEPIYDAALKVLARERDQSKGQPVFVMVLTIFNHGEHGVKMQRVPPATWHAAQAAFPDSQPVSRNVADYLWRTSLFQEAMGNMQRKVLEGPRPAVVGWFGDHQPPFGGALALRDRIHHFGNARGDYPARFETWYHVASNRGAAAPTSAAPLDIAFLPGLLAEIAGAQKDEWLAANAIARERCGGLLTECRDPAARDAYLSFLVHDLRSFGGD